MAGTRVVPSGTSQSLPKRSRKHHWLSWKSNFKKAPLTNVTHCGYAVSITYNASTLMWSTENMGFSDEVATNPGSLASGLLGTSKRTVYNDSRKCSLTSSYKILLTLTACQKHEFTCVDAKCIPMEARLNDTKYNDHVLKHNT